MRIILTQPSLAKYRAPVYRELASRKDVEFHLVFAESPVIPNVEPEGFNAEFSPIKSIKTPLGRFLWHPAQMRYAKSQHCDTLILSWDVHYLSLIPAIIKARRNGVRTVLWGHGYSKTESKLRRQIRDCIGRMADAILLYDQQTANRLIARGFAPDKVFVAPNAIDQSAIQAARQDWLSHTDKLNKFKHDNGLDAGPVILFVSRLDPDNRLDLLIDALALSSGNLPNAQLIIIGKGDEEKHKLMALAKKRDLSNRVRFLGAIYEESKLAPWFLCADAFCYPANIGLSILHAFGYGLPVITSDKSKAQNPEVVALQSGINGWTYADGNAHALAKTLANTLTDTVLQQKMCKAATETAKVYSIKAMADGFVAASSAPPS